MGRIGNPSYGIRRANFERSRAGYSRPTEPASTGQVISRTQLRARIHELLCNFPWLRADHIDDTLESRLTRYRWKHEDQSAIGSTSSRNYRMLPMSQETELPH
jgi:hypothetical protein